MPAPARLLGYSTRGACTTAIQAWVSSLHTHALLLLPAPVVYTPHLRGIITSVQPLARGSEGLAQNRGPTCAPPLGACDGVGVTAAGCHGVSGGGAVDCAGVRALRWSPSVQDVGGVRTFSFPRAVHARHTRSTRGGHSAVRMTPIGCWAAAAFHVAGVAEK
jgi:hypothetical protein